MAEFNTFATFYTIESHREQFIKGNLVEVWSSLYPFLFDAQDTQIALNQRHLGYHYHEWFAAILIYHTRGLLSLIETYAYKSHNRQRKILETLVTPETFEFITSRGISSVTQCPDLLVYTSDKTDWFFCEVKGPNDKLHNKQIAFFHELENSTGKRIAIVNFISTD